MKINLAKNIGFCFGVNRAYNIVDKFDKSKNHIYILGSLAHNPTVEKQITKWKITKIDDLSLLKKDDIVIITAHGIDPNIINKIKEKKANILDTTCPKVAKIHDLVKKHYKNNFTIIIFGDKNHKEVIGINGACGHQATVVDSLKEITAFLKNYKSNKPICLVSQTTQNTQYYEDIKKYVRVFSKKNNIQYISFDTICLTTQNRQTEITSLAKQNTSVLIIGGIHSANTKRLCEISKQYNKNTFCIDELNQKGKKYIDKYIINTNVDSLAIISGASTPIDEINKIINYIKHDKSII